MGCCIWELSSFDEPHVGFDYEWDSNWEDKNLPLACSPEGVKQLLAEFGSAGAIATWADVVPKKGSRGFSGLRFYRYLKRNGYDVGQSKIVNNPSGSREVQLYWWYFRSPPRRTAQPSRGARTKPSAGVRRSTTTARGETVEQKTKASTNRSTSRSRRFS